MIPVKKNKLIGSVFSIYITRLLKKHFNSIQTSGEDNLSKLNASLPVILYANHYNWWDGFIAYLLTNKKLNADDYLMMDIEQMRKYSFFKYVGVFSVNRNDPREGMESINYAADLLKGTKKYLWIFPQGIMQPQDMRPLKFYSGITRIAEKLGEINLVPAAFRYEFVNEQRPEVFIKIGEPDTVNNNIIDTKQYTEYLQEKLTRNLDELKQYVLSSETNKFKIIFKVKSSRNKTFDKLHGE